MKMHDINRNKERTILLIHPMLSSANSMKMLIADYLGDDYRYLIPDISNHGEDKQTYQSAAKEAEAIYTYLKENQALDLQLAFGASLGGVVLFELLKYSDLNFKHIFFEGVSFYEHAALQNCILKKIFLGKHRKAVQNPELSVKKMAQIYGKEASKSMANAFISINEKSIENIVYDCAYVNLPELSKMVQKKCTFAYGEKDSDSKRAKKLQPVKYPEAEMKIWKGYDHCTKITENPRAYAEMLKTYL